MLTRIRSVDGSKRYHVATETGWPSARRLVITAGLGLASSARTSSGRGGVATRVLQDSVGAPAPGVDPYPRRRRFTTCTSGGTSGGEDDLDVLTPGCRPGYGPGCRPRRWVPVRSV